MKQEHLYLLPGFHEEDDPRPDGPDHIPDVGPPCTISELPRELRAWCLLGEWLPAGWAVSPPFRAEFGAPWTIVAWNERSTEASDPPWYEVGHGDQPIDAVDDLLGHFEC